MTVVLGNNHNKSMSNTYNDKLDPNKGIVVVINDIYNVDEINNAIDTIRGIIPQIFAEIRSNIEYKEWRILRNHGYHYFEDMTSNEMLDSDDNEVNTLINSNVGHYISNTRNLFARINGNDYRLIQILGFENFPMWQIWECLYNEDAKWDPFVGDVCDFVRNLRNND